MKNVLLGSCLLLGLPLSAASAGPEDSVVRITASVRYPNPLRPWAKAHPVEVFGTGVVIEGKRILTSAHLVMYAADLHVQSRPGDDKVEAKIEALGTDVDLAVLSVKEDKFFEKRPALLRTSKLPAVQDTVVVYGFPKGGNDLSVTKGVVSRIAVALTPGGAAGLMIQVSAAINDGNSGGPALVGSQMVGLVASRLVEGENIGYILANDEIETFLKTTRLGRYEGKLEDASRATYQRLENPTLRRMLKVGEDVRGVMVRPPSQPAEDCPFQPLDIVTKIGDYGINNEGMAQWENGLRVPFTWLASKVARDGKAPLTIWRNGRSMSLSLPVTSKDLRLIREYNGEPAAYFIHGPLTFSPAVAEATHWYGQVNPSYGLGGSPVINRRFDRMRFPGEELVVVTAPMFHHKITKGYGDPIGRVIHDINGTKIKNLRHLVEVLRDSTHEFLTFRFAEEGSEMLVFDRKEMNQVTDEILEENGIAPSRRGSPEMLKVWKSNGAK